VDHRSDLFSLGATFYEIVNGRPLFAGYTGAVGDVPDRSELKAPLQWSRSDIPEALKKIIKRLLETDPGRRYAGAEELRADLLVLPTISDGLSPADMAIRWTGAKSRGRRFFSLVVPGVLLVALALVLATRQPPISLTDWTRAALHAPPEPARQAVWSPDRTQFAFETLIDREWHIAVKRIDETSPRILADMQYGFHANSIDWSTADGRIYYTHSYLNLLFAVDPDTGEQEEVLRDVFSATLSPDGGTLVFVGPEGLMISSPPGAPPRRYEPYPEDEIELYWLPVYVRFSQDGEKIAFGSNRMDLEWFSHEGAGSLEAALLPTKESAQEHGTLWVFPWPDGEGVTPWQPFDLTPDLHDQPPTFTWWTDNRHLLMSQFTSSLEGGLLLGDTRSGNLSNIYPSSDALTFPSLSADGRNLLYTRESTDYNIVEVFLDGSPPRDVLSSTLRKYSASYSPDGSICYFTDREGRAEIRYQDTDADDRLLINQDRFPDDQQPLSLWPPGRISPDGRLIAFRASTRQAPFSAYVASVEGEEHPEPLLPAGWHCEYLSWAPGSDSLACAVRKPDGRFEVVIVTVGDPSSVQTICEQRVITPQWSPDGDRITGIIPLAPTFGMIILSRNGEVPRRFHFDSDDHQAIVWSRDGTRLYHAITASWRSGLFEVDMETGEQTQILDFPPSFTIANPIINTTFGSLSPDGRSFLTTSRTYQADIYQMEDSGRRRRWW